MPHSRTIWILGCSWFVGAALTLYARRAPDPLPETAPATAFSQVRAQRVLQRVAGDAEPRTPGSEASERTLARLSSELETLGLSPEHQRTFACSLGSCAYVHNLLARIDGAEAGHVLLVAHHDSVGAGPGASDDGIGVAVVFETLRALRAGPPLRHGVIALIDDAEEVGSVGATAFATEHEWVKDVAAVVNVDNGGTTGLSLLYGTGPGKLGVVDVYASAVRHPASSSVFAVAQRHLPRFSDFNVFQRLNLPGMNFAFAGGETRYHTARDTVALSDPASFQHEGDSVLASVRALTASDLKHLVTREAEWFDLFGAFVVRWPAAWSLPLALFTCVLLAFGAGRERLQLTAAVIKIGVVAGATCSSGALAWAIQWLLGRAGLIPATFVAQPGWLFAAMSSLALLCTLASSRVLMRFDPRSVELGVWLAWTICAALTSIKLPGASVLFLPVPLSAACARAVLGRKASGTALTYALAGLVAAATWFPGLALAPETFGISTLLLFAAPCAWLASLLLPGLAAINEQQNRRIMLIATAGLVLSLAAHAAFPKCNESAPQRVNVVAYTDASAKRSFAIVDTAWIGPRAPVPTQMKTELAKLAKREPYEAAPFEWREAKLLMAPLAETQISRPTLEVVSQTADTQTTTLRIQLAPRARHLNVFASNSAPIRALTLGAQHWPSTVQSGRAAMRYRVWSLYAPKLDTTLQIEWDGSNHEPTDLLLVSESPEIPAPLRPLLRSRPTWAAQSQSGDRTLVSTRLRL